MAESFYLIDRKKRQECNFIETKLREKMFPEFFNKIKHEFVIKDSIGLETIEVILDSIFKSVLTYSENNFPNAYFDERLGFYSISGSYPYFVFDNIYIDNFGTISNMETLKSFLDRNSDFIIEDEDGNAYSFNEFCKHIDL